MEISTHSLPDLCPPFFRMYLLKRNVSHQHKLLIDLEKRHPHSVYYAAPTMGNAQAFHAAYASARIPHESVFFSPQDIGPLPDDRQHVVAYCRGLEHAWLCSTPSMITASKFGRIERHLRTSFEQVRPSTLEAVVDDIRESLLVLIGESVHRFQTDMRQGIRQRRARLDRQDRTETSETRIVEDLLVSRQVALIRLGLELIIAQPS